MFCVYIFLPSRLVKGEICMQLKLLACHAGGGCGNSFVYAKTIVHRISIGYIATYNIIWPLLCREMINVWEINVWSSKIHVH